MSNRASALFVAALLALGALAGCGRNAETLAPETAPTATGPVVKTLSFPADWLVARIGGDRVERTCVLPAGEDAPFWSPTAEVIASLGEADLIVASGAGYEKWTETATLPMSKFVDAAATVPLIEIEGVAHSHGPEGEHSHTGVDPHVFTDPLSYLTQAQSIHSALTAADPGGRATYDANLAALRTDLDALDAELKQATAPLQSRALAANHPSFNYLARRYGLSIRTFDLDPEAAPAAKTVAEIEAWMKEAGATPVMIWEATPQDAVKAALPAGLQHAVVDPLEQPGADGRYDYLAQARANLAVWRAITAPGA